MSLLEDIGLCLVMERALSCTGCINQPREGVMKPEASIFHVQEGLRHNTSGHDSWMKDRSGGNFCRNSQDLRMGQGSSTTPKKGQANPLSIQVLTESQKTRGKADQAQERTPPLLKSKRRSMNII